MYDQLKGILHKQYAIQQTFSPYTNYLLLLRKNKTFSLSENHRSTSFLLPIRRISG